MHLATQVSAENQNRMKGIYPVFAFFTTLLACRSSLAAEPDLFVLGIVAEVQHGRSCAGSADGDEWSLLTVDLPASFPSELESELKPFLTDGKQLRVEGRYAQVLDVQEKRKYWFTLALSDGKGIDSSKVGSPCLRLKGEGESILKHPMELPRTKLRRQTRTVEKEGVCCTYGLKHHKKNQNSFKWCKNSENVPDGLIGDELNKCRSGSILCCDCCHIGYKASRLGLSYCRVAAHSSSGTCSDVLLDCCFKQTVNCSALTHPGNGYVLLSDGISYQSVANYSCVAGYTLKGPTMRRCQATEQWSGSEPTCERVSCGQLDAPSNGAVNTSAGTSFGDVAKYSCDAGYTLNRPAERTCQADRQWSGSVPTCERVSCGQLDAPSNGAVDTSAGISFGDVARYSCDAGYTLNGPAERRCQANRRWSGTEPTCERVSCGQPDAPSNGAVDTSDGTSFGDVAKYSCGAGYTENGPAERRCQADGKWSGSVPTCERVSCGQPSIPSNGAVNTSDGTSFGDVARYSCDAGYTVNGPTERTCQADRLWNGTEPTCERVSCGQLDAPSNGAVNTSDGTSFGDVARYSCGAGYTVNGPTERRCQADRQWSGSVPTCERVSCGHPGDPSNGRVDTSDGTSFEDKATYECDNGYTLNGPAERTCQADGKWSGSVPTCEIVDCGSPTSIPDGTVSLINSTTTFNSMARYDCRPGFQEVGSAKRICKATGQWSGSEPTCQRVSCGEPATPSNGRVVTNDRTSFEDVASYSCDNGYTLNGVDQRTCQANGMWNGSVPTCERVSCGQLDAPSNGAVNTSDGTSFGDVARYSCGVGYTLNGPTERTCQAEGQWNGSETSCERVSCGVLAAPSDGRVDTSDGTLFGDVAKYSCDEGYILNGPAKRTCQADGEWSGSMPTCQIDCGSPTLPNGTFTLVNGRTTFNSKATYECRTGFKLIGSAMGLCQANGKWEGSEGRSCREKKDCALPLDIMIVLDHSASVKQKSFDKQTDFIRGFVSLLPVAKDNVRVGLIRYWYIVELVFDFDDFFTDTALESVISAMRRPKWRQRTSTGAALQRMVDTFTGDSGARDPTAVSRVAIVVTDGKATDEIDVALQEAQNNNITIYAYGIGNAFREGSDELKELQKLASDETKVEVIQDSTEDLSNLVNRLINQFVNCDDSSASTPPPAPPACQQMEYYNQTTHKCEECNCNGFERTTAPLQCDPITGSCICRDKDRRGGPHCDRCIWELRGDGCDMCREGMKIPKNKEGPEHCQIIK